MKENPYKKAGKLQKAQKNYILEAVKYIAIKLQQEKKLQKSAVKGNFGNFGGKSEWK